MRHWTVRSLTLWLGMYGITLILFTLESGDLRTGAVFGLISASLKAAWAAAHRRLHRPAEVPVWTDYHI